MSEESYPGMGTIYRLERENELLRAALLVGKDNKGCYLPLTDSYKDAKGESVALTVVWSPKLNDFIVFEGFDWETMQYHYFKDLVAEAPYSTGDDLNRAEAILNIKKQIEENPCIKDYQERPQQRGLRIEKVDPERDSNGDPETKALLEELAKDPGFMKVTF